MYEFNSLNHALVGMSRELLENGVIRKTRGYSCLEINHPVIICIKNPSDRYVNIPERKWNKILSFAESLWLVLGLNDLDVLTGKYVENLYSFSDDGKYWRAGYGPRIRAFSGLGNDYKISDPKFRNIYSGAINIVDQLNFVIKKLQKDFFSRQAIITIHDPAKDDFDLNKNLKITKDQPCTRSIHFQMNTKHKLDCIVHMRSNDVLWGFSGVNVFNFSFMQEYVSLILGAKVGEYYHIVDNFHVYENYIPNIKRIADTKYNFEKRRPSFYYEDLFGSLKNFDERINKLFEFEKNTHLKDFDKNFNFEEEFDNDFIRDWAKMFYHRNMKINVTFKNPYLNHLINKLHNENYYL